MVPAIRLLRGNSSLRAHLKVGCRMSRINVRQCVVLSGVILGTLLLVDPASAQCQGGGSRGGGQTSTATTTASSGTSSSGAVVFTSPGSWMYEQQMLAQAEQQRRQMLAQAVAAYQAKKAQQEAQRRYYVAQRRDQELARRQRMRDFLASQNGTQQVQARPSYSASYASSYGQNLYRPASFVATNR